MTGLEPTDIALIALVTVLLIENAVAFALTRLRRKDEGRPQEGDSYLVSPRQLLVFCLLGGAPGVLIGLIAFRRGAMPRWLRNASIGLAIPQLLVGLLLSFFAVYVTDFYAADETALQALESDATVLVSREPGYTLFDGPGTEEALVFYPGGLVQDTAYAPLMREIAARGVDCYLEHMPYRLAFFGINNATDVLGKSPAKYWYIGGHSLGGVAASMYASQNYELLDGVVFFASYPSVDLSSLPLLGLSIVGDCDQVVSRDAMEAARASLPALSQEFVIKGGNHGQFGSYGFQEGDGQAAISPQKQQAEAAEITVGFIKEYSAAKAEIRAERRSS